MTVDEFRRELVGVPLCGTPETAPSPARCCAPCTCPTAPRSSPAQALVVYGLWEAVGGQVCRRNAHDPADQRRCVSTSGSTQPFRNSDGVGFASDRARRTDERRALWPASPKPRLVVSSSSRNHLGGLHACSDCGRRGAALSGAALAASKLTPKEIQTEFFDGKAFTAATTSGTKFKMTFTADGKVTREPQDRPARRARALEAVEGRFLHHLERQRGELLHDGQCRRRTSGRW